MSGIYIPGMEMPEHCGECLSHHYLFGRDICWAAKGRRVELMPNKRPDWCPLVAVPDHGRLIEAEELRWVFEKNFGDDTFSFQIIDAAPTIIPADKEGDGKISYSHFKGSNLCPLEAKND